uniref:N-acetylneuraminate-9-phosphate synthase n=1 Tax=Strigamia maritima TaxID=126957 RepID=T1IIV7_STRMM
MPLEFELCPGRKIGGYHGCFIIAEIGQNHQGDVEIAKEMTKKAKECGADCVKFQKSNLQQKFNLAALQRPYKSQHSFGVTYGEHKKKLELSEEDYIELKTYAEEIGIVFAASGMDETSVDFLDNLNVPFFKVGSGDTNNFPYLIHSAQKQKPLIISSGMQTMNTMKQVYSLIKPINKNICFLQCTSCYPTLPADVHLRIIQTYQKEFPDIPIGYSGHETGISISLAAVALGAKVLERHFTLDKTWKGSDHQASLEPAEFAQLVNQVRVVELALGSPEKHLLACEVPCYEKLGKTVVAVRDLSKGQVLTQEMLRIKVAEPKGWKAEKIHELIGRTLIRDIACDDSIKSQDIL